MLQINFVVGNATENTKNTTHFLDYSKVRLLTEEQFELLLFGNLVESVTNVAWKNGADTLFQ